MGPKQDTSETALGKFGYGERNERGSRLLLNYLQQHGSYAMNSFFGKKSQNRWTWINRDGRKKNEIDYIFSNRKKIVHDVLVLNRFSTGSDHRMIRTKVVLNTKPERVKMMERRRIGPTAWIQDCGEITRRKQESK